MRVRFLCNKCGAVNECDASRVRFVNDDNDRYAAADCGVCYCVVFWYNHLSLDTLVHAQLVFRYAPGPPPDVIVRY